VDVSPPLKIFDLERFEILEIGRQENEVGTVLLVEVPVAVRA